MTTFWYSHSNFGFSWQIILRFLHYVFYRNTQANFENCFLWTFYSTSSRVMSLFTLAGSGGFHALWIHYFFYYFVFVILMRCLIDTQSLESLYIFSENTAMDFSDLLGGESYPIELIQDLPEDFPVSI
jgi:hypothetical protein